MANVTTLSADKLNDLLTMILSATETETETARKIKAKATRKIKVEAKRKWGPNVKTAPKTKTKSTAAKSKYISGPRVTCAAHGEFGETPAGSAKGSGFHAGWCKIAKKRGFTAVAPAATPAAPVEPTAPSTDAFGNDAGSDLAQLRDQLGLVFGKGSIDAAISAAVIAAGPAAAKRRKNRVPAAVPHVTEAGPSAVDGGADAPEPRPKFVGLTSGAVDLATMPADWMLDKRGRPLRGTALKARIDKWEREQEAPAADVSAELIDETEAEMRSAQRAQIRALVDGFMKQSADMAGALESSVEKLLAR
jgi:hypothetical protein